MHPLFIQLGDLKIFWYGVMVALGFFAGLANWAWLGRKDGRSFNFCSDLLFWTMISGIVGARIAYVASDWREYVWRPWAVFRLDQGGLIYYGGFLGAVVGLYLFARRRKLAIPAFADFVITALPLGHAFGRIGCFLNGCCHGSIHGGPLSVVFPKGSFAFNTHLYAGLITQYDDGSLPVHPVQLYEAGINLLIYAFLVWLYRRKKRDGIVAAAYLLAYPPTRFLLEFLRADERMRWAGVSVAQWLSLALFALGCVLLLKIGIRDRTDKHAQAGGA